MKYITTVGDKEFTIEITGDGGQRQVLIDGKPFDVDFVDVGGPVYSLLLNGHSYDPNVYHSEEGLEVLLEGSLYPVMVEDERERRLRSSLGARVSERDEFTLRAPMPGMVIGVPVAEGQTVEKGDVLVILESMKMQNELKAPRAGTVSRVRIKGGDSVEQRQVMLSVV